jgi:DNA-binding CsgD family transcriptional regulator
MQEDSMSSEQAALDDFEPTGHLIVGGTSVLTPAERECFEAIERGEYGVREYARRTGRAPGTVGNLLARARSKVGDAA